MQADNNYKNCGYASINLSTSLKQLITLGLIPLALASCGGGGGSTPASTSTPPAATEVETPAQPAEPVVVTDLTGNTSPESYAGYNLLWSDEFSGSALDNAKWGYDIGGDGWGNNELQYHRAENASVDGGYLIIEARKESYGGRSYTSSRINTKDKFSFQYGRVDIRAAMPEGKGLWPALWMLGQNFSTVGWPYCGEIDIMEMIGGNGLENRTVGTAHWNNGGLYESDGVTKKPYNNVSYGDNYSLSGTDTLANGFHIYGLTWTPDSITWYIDSVQYHTMAIDSGASLAAFQKDFFLIFNVAVGGDWPGAPEATTVFPQRMLVDYVRVFQQD